MNIDLERNNLPDFIIGGAMKSGTSSLHSILDSHPRIFLAEEEIFFFDIDEMGQHIEFLIKDGGDWTFFDFEERLDQYLEWYASFFEKASQDQIVGERSTSYLASDKAPERIFNLLPQVKLIFLLRDPVERTYSHYWHLVRTGRTVYNFEKTLQHNPRNLIEWSLYKKQVEKYTKFFPEEKMKFIIFQEFVENKRETTNDLLSFLEIEEGVEELKIHRNKGRGVRCLKLQLLWNWLWRDFYKKRYTEKLPGLHPPSYYPFFKIMYSAFNKINLPKNRKYPSMKKNTRRFLQKVFRRENKGLSSLINQDVSRYWPYMK